MNHDISANELRHCKRAIFLQIFEFIRFKSFKLTLLDLTELISQYFGLFIKLALWSFNVIKVFFWKGFYSIFEFQIFGNFFGFIINFSFCVSVGFFVRRSYVVLQQFVICSDADFVQVGSFVRNKFFNF